MSPYKQLYYLTFLSFYFLTSTSIASNYQEDSLKVEQLVQRSLKVVYSQPDSALFYCKAALKIGGEDLYLKSKTLNHLGIYYDVTSNNDSAIECYNQAIALAIKGNSEIIEASALNNIGLIYWNQADYNNAIKYFNQSIILFEKLEMQVGISSTLNNIGLIYNETKNYNKAIEYFHKSKLNYQKIDNKYGVSATYTNLAIAHHFLENFDSSFYYNSLSIPLKIEINDNWGLATNYVNLATDYNHFKKSDSALTYAIKAEALYRQLNNKSQLSTALSAKGKFLLDLKQYKESFDALNEAETLAIATKSKKTLKNVYDHFANLNKRQNKFREGYSYLEKRLAIEADIYNTEKDKAITEIQTKYETAKKDKEIAENKEELLQKKLIVKTKNNQLLIALFLVVLLITFIYILIQFQLNKRKKLKLQYEVQQKINEANFNKEIAEDKLRISRELHDNIGAHLTFIIASVDNLTFTEQLVDRKEKMKAISSFGRQTMKELRGTIWAIKNDGASINELLFRVSDLKINVDIPISIINEIKVDHQLTSTQLLNLYRVIQEAIQNTTKHANATELFVQFSSSKDSITITIKDNGKGFTIKDKYKSYGLKNMKTRSNNINANFSIESSDLGTSIICKLPIKTR